MVLLERAALSSTRAVLGSWQRPFYQNPKQLKDIELSHVACPHCGNTGLVDPNISHCPSCGKYGLSLIDDQPSTKI